MRCASLPPRGVFGLVTHTGPALANCLWSLPSAQTAYGATAAAAATLPPTDKSRDPADSTW